MHERPAKSREAPDWVKHLAPFVVAVPLAVGGLAWVLYYPPRDYASAVYIAFSAAVGLAIWLALGSDEIPGRAAQRRGRRALRLSGIPLFVGVLLAGYALNQVQTVASSFGWIAVIAAVKTVYLVGLRERLAPCPKCGATRWFIRDGSEYYCPRCGTRLRERDAAIRT